MILTTIQQQVLPRNKTRTGATEKSGISAEFLRLAKPAGGYTSLRFRLELFNCLPTRRGKSLMV